MQAKFRLRGALQARLKSLAQRSTANALARLPNVITSLT